MIILGWLVLISVVCFLLSAMVFLCSVAVEEYGLGVDK